ncbi:hypothetical protein [Intrasporangium calvum]|uniref:hypothetical protein n=1 Tax=Intrasporangium calvum TaxID=53358 RepID=UPI00059D9306|nr:hypothetical protein [Intrasporangium calvum]AXG13099.1 hypothetical protein DN585_06455 [Intrasporangium calvum]
MPETRSVQHTGRGPGRLIVALYGLLALAATGRSVLQIVEYFDRAPVPYLLSALAALIYIVATVGLARGDRVWVRIASVAIVIELVGVLVVGAVSYAAPDRFPDKTVWSHFGQGYGYVPLVLPVLGLLWIRRNRQRRTASVG